MRRNQSLCKLLVACVAALTILALDTAAASAAPGYAFVPPAFGAGEIFVGLAVDNSGSASAGDVYLADLEGGTLDKFEPGGVSLGSLTGAGFGSSLGPWATAVDSTTGNVYVSIEDPAPGKVDEFDPAGTEVSLPAGAFQPVVEAGGPTAEEVATYEPSGVAVDETTGDVYVADRHGANSVVYKFTAEGAYLGRLGKGVLASPVTLAVDSSGNVFVVDGSTDVQKFSSAGVSLGVFGKHEGSNAIAIDHSTGDIYIYEEAGADVVQYDSTGTEISSFGGGIIVAPVYGLAVLESNHAVYAASLSPGAVRKFELGEAPPTPETLPVTGVEETEATFHGKVSPGEGSGVSYYFRYNQGASCEGGATTPEHPVTAGEEVEEKVTGLSAGTEYTVCVVVTNAFGSPAGEGVSFTTNAALVIAETGLPTNPLAESATLNGTVKVGAGATAHYYFEYGVKAEPVAYTSTTPALPGVEVGEGEHLVSTPATELEPNTSYDYQLVATSGASTVTGGNQELTTAQAPPVAVGKAATNVTRTEASLPGEIDPKKSKTTYFFEYGPTTAYGSTSATEETSATLGLAPIGPARLSELHAGTTYHYRLVASSGGGEDTGEDMTFSTAAAQLPIVEAESSEQVTQTTATVKAKVNPNGLQTTYILEVGTEVEGKVAYTPTFGEVGSGPEGVSLTFALTNLLPGTTYHYRIVAVNEDGTIEGADITFATTSFANPIVEPPHPLIIPVPPEEKMKKKTETKLEKALKACKTKPKKKRAACDRQAEKKYGPKVHRKTKPKHKKK